MNTVKPNIIDRLVGWVSPARAFKRMQYRQAFNLFEGASRGRRTKNWRTPGTSIQADTRKGLSLLRARSRDMAQNNAYAAAAHREIPANVIGQGIRPQPIVEDPERRAEVEGLVRSWFETPVCDADGRLNFFGLQNLAFRTVVESGEALIVRQRQFGPGSNVPLQIRVLEPDHIDTSKDSVINNGNRIVQGVEFNARGQRIAYWLYDEHPGDASFTSVSLKSRRVPAGDVLHMFRVDRAGQVRGVPWAAPVLIRMRDFDEYEDAQLTRQKIAACFSVFITPGDSFGPSQNTTDEEADLLPDTVAPGIIEELRDGKDVKFANPPGVQGYGEYSNVTLHQIATGYGLPYSVLTGDLSSVNFSSGRMGLMTFHRNVVGWQRHLVIPQMCQPVWSWWAEAVQTAGLAEELPPAKWSPPRRELTDPSREIPAIRDSVRAGLITLPEAIRQQGFEPDEFIREVQAFNEQIDESGLVFDTDPRKVSAAGLTQARPEGTQIPSTEVDDD